MVTCVTPCLLVSTMRGSLWRRGPASRAGTVRVMRTVRQRASLALPLAFAGSAGVHLLRPQSFASIMPRAIPQEHHTNLIYASGVAELICAIGLFRRTRWAGPASVAVLAAVFPANVQMALDSGSGRHRDRRTIGSWPGHVCRCRR